MAKEIDKKPSPAPARSSNAEIDAFLRKVATTPNLKPAGQRGRLLFAMDATASRQPTWDRASQIQAEMFAETAALGGLDVKLAYFRGFGECRASPWVSDGQKMAHYMGSIFCLGGQTQIGKILKLCIDETRAKKVNALVYVGDCMEEDVDHLCNLAGEIGMLGVPAFLFHEGPDPTARRAFQQIARLTGGAYCAFDAASPRALRDLLSAVAVYAAGGRPALANYARKAGAEVLQITRQLR